MRLGLGAVALAVVALAILVGGSVSGAVPVALVIIFGGWLDLLWEMRQ